MTPTIPEDAAELRRLKKLAAHLDLEAKTAKADAQEAELKLIDRMEAEKVESIKYDGTLFVPVETQYGQVQDRAAFVEWAEENAPELVEARERKALVNELIREHLDNGTPLPAGLGFYTKQYISLRTAAPTPRFTPTTDAERLAAAEARSAELEREAGLRFDESDLLVDDA